MGIIWAIMYSFLNVLIPGSFSGLSVESEQGRLLEFIYYSFVTLTTLGYGDLLPVSPIARAFGYLEAVIGQIYVAVLIAGLVGIHVSNRQEQ
ncbi:MAG: two pore domain potassium channel family protein [Gammaproteobacteria bacterium]|nr:two pore domain potassium channel family protein [Gammaproteobacteria bacterium]